MEIRAVKPFVHQIERPDGVLIFDDNLEEKPYMATNPLIRYHFDHCLGRTIKGINQLTALYHSGTSSLPVAYELIQKDQQKLNTKTGKTQWVSAISKHQLLRRMVKQCIANNLIFKYVLADCWYSCADTFTYLNDLERHFIMPIKANRKVALSQLDHQQGCYQSIESLALEESQLLVVWLKDVAFPLHLTRQVFKDGGLIQGELYLVTNDSTADRVCIQTQYARRWKIEEFHKSIKSNTGYGGLRGFARSHRWQSKQSSVFGAVGLCQVGSVAIVDVQKSFCFKEIADAECDQVGFAGTQQPKKSIYSIG